MIVRFIRLLAFFLLCLNFQSKTHINLSWYKPFQHMAYVAGDGLYEIFSRDSFALFTLAIPMYGLAKLIDDSVHKNFFCYSCKKNKNQSPLLFKISHESIIAGLIGVTLFSLSYGYMKDVDFYYQGIGSLASILSTWGIKNIFKGLWQYESGLRPYDEKYAPYKRAYGGCPSGHIAFAAAMTAYWFRERGPAWGLPFLALGVIGVGGVVSANRHYVSQTIVGFTLGAIIGISMSKGVDFLRSVCDDIQYGLTYDSSNPTFYCQYTY